MILNAIGLHVALNGYVKLAFEKAKNGTKLAFGKAKKGIFFVFISVKEAIFTIKQ
jgi:hypothetical protein